MGMNGPPFGGGGRGMGGGSMLRAVGRAVRAGGVAGAAGGGFPETFSTSTATPTSPRSASSGNNNNNNNANPRSSNPHLSISSVSAPSSPCNKKPLYGGGAAMWPPFPSDDYEMVSSWDETWGEDENSVRNYYLDEFVLGPVPSVDEVQNAVSALQQVFDCSANPPLVRDRFGPPVDKEISEGDWIEPAVHFGNSRAALQAYGCDKVYDAFHMLQTDPTVQRMVVSLSSDKAVWDAVLKNEAVKQLKEALRAETESSPNEVSQEDESSGGSNTVMDVIKRLFDDTKEKFMVVIDKLTKLVTEQFQPPVDSKEETTIPPNSSFEEKLRKSFMLSVVVLLVVVVTRARIA